jgi:hypothetical protein
MGRDAREKCRRDARLTTAGCRYLPQTCNCLNAED